MRRRWAIQCEDEPTLKRIVEHTLDGPAGQFREIMTTPRAACLVDVHLPQLYEGTLRACAMFTRNHLFVYTTV